MRLLLLFVVVSSSVSGQMQVALNQHTFSSTSNGYEGTNIQIDYTIGELAAVTTLVQPGFIFTQGLHQPDKFAVGIHDPEKPAWHVTAFPNPFSGNLSLQIETLITDKITIELFDAAGRLIHLLVSTTISPGNSFIPLDFRNVSGGTYLLRIRSEKNESQTMIPLVRLFE